jgi:hypothetical protein
MDSSTYLLYVSTKAFPKVPTYFDLWVYVVKISEIRSVYFLRYALWKIGFLNGPEINFKRVRLEFSL